MFHLDGKEYKKLALHGGGTPMLGVYLGMFEKLNFDESILNIPFITSSAGSMAILFFLMKKIMKNTDIRAIFTKIFSIILEEFENVLSNFEQKGIVSSQLFDDLISTECSLIYNMTFKDLSELYPNLDWTICCSKYNNYEFSLITYGPHTPGVKIWKACLGSMSVPILFEPVEINGTLNSDGSLAAWVQELDLIDDQTVLHIGASKASNEFGDTVYTGVSLIDELIGFFSCSLMNMVRKPVPSHGILTTEFLTSITKDIFSEEYIESGKLIAEKFVLK